VAFPNDPEMNTPKRLAQYILADAVAVARGYWTEKDIAGDIELTEREKALVDDQLKKLGDRIAKLLGYTESWSGYLSLRLFRSPGPERPVETRPLQQLDHHPKIRRISAIRRGLILREADPDNAHTVGFGDAHRLDCGGW